ncbi:MAG: hypothetical protein CR988_02240 [Treponema sp.]|nr:MAG: hypothetical protein CR988_02240 [Treponema sp.]
MVKKIGILFLLFSIISSVAIFAQEGKTLQAKAKILEIESKRSGRKVMDIARILYKTQDGREIETVVQLDRIPFLGSFKSVGDEIEINYDVENPSLVYTNAGNFITKYGLYILIIIGVITSIGSFVKAKKNK